MSIFKRKCVCCHTQTTHRLRVKAVKTPICTDSDQIAMTRLNSWITAFMELFESVDQICKNQEKG